MKDFEIFLDDSILPDIEKKINPPANEEEAEEGEEAAEQEDETE
jgi:hypothetical protein